MSDLQNSHILMGRGAMAQRHQGSIEFREIVREYVVRYENAANKSTVVTEIFQRLQGEGRQFVKHDMDNACYREITTQQAQGKISNRIRDEINERQRETRPMQ